MSIRRLAVLAAVLGILSTLLPSAAYAAQPAQPDLGMARLRKFTIETTPAGQKRLRFSTKIINIGAGPFEVLGHHPQPNDTKLVNQRIRNHDGTWTSRPTKYRMYFAGDGHNHWHLRDLEGYTLKNMSGTITRVSEKHGFCFKDLGDYNLSLPHAPQNAVYPGCGNISDVNVTMGLSVGWSDTYGFDLVGQWIDITGVPDGTYTVTARVDALRDFVERCEDNNWTTATVQISGTSVTILDDGKNSKAC